MNGDNESAMTQDIRDGQGGKGASANAETGSRPTEQWVAITEYEGLYDVSNLGRVRSLRSGRIMAQVLDGRGYATAKLYKNGGVKRFTTHRLVASAFLGDKRNVLHREVAHLDGSRTNSRAENLKWVSPAENADHKRLHGRHQARANHPRAKLSESDVAIIRASSESNCALGRKFGVYNTAISKIRRGDRWK